MVQSLRTDHEMCIRDRVYIDGSLYEECGTYPESFFVEQTELGSDEYFVLEDNPKATDDKEHIVKKRDIKGKVMVTH